MICGDPRSSASPRRITGSRATIPTSVGQFTLRLPFKGQALWSKGLARQATPIIIVAVLIASMLAVGFQTPLSAQGVSCASFASRAAAQAALAASPTVAATLDADRDGRACEEILDPEPGDGEGGAAGTGLTGADIDCADLSSQPIAQRILERNPSDPFNLDPNG